MPLFNPRMEVWKEHFTWIEDYTKIVGLTATGRATINGLQLNCSLLVRARQRWRMTGRIPVSDIPMST